MQVKLWLTLMVALSMVLSGADSAMAKSKKVSVKTAVAQKKTDSAKAAAKDDCKKPEAVEEGCRIVRPNKASNTTR
jgi:hypothetical protein